MNYLKCIFTCFIVSGCTKRYDIVSYINKANASNVSGITIYSMDTSKKRCGHYESVDSIRTILSSLKICQKVNSNSINLRSHIRFFAINIVGKNGIEQEIDVVETTESGGVINTESPGFLLKNDSILGYLTKLCR